MYYVKRALAFAVDRAIILLFSLPLFFLGPRMRWEYIVYPTMKMILCYGAYLSLLVFGALSLFRDLPFKNGSLGKLIFGLRVIDRRSGAPARTTQRIVRNMIFCFTIPNIVVFFILGRSLGDLIARTQVVTKNESK